MTAAAPAPADAFDEPIRCGIDSVEIARIERLLAETPADELRKLYSANEIGDSGDGAGRGGGGGGRYAGEEGWV